MFNDYLFLRSAELIIGEKVKTTNGPIEPPSARKYEGFRISFKVEKNDKGKPNKTVIKIYNLNRDSLSFLERENLIVFLRTSYAGKENLSTLFFGDLIRFNEERNGPDIITNLECGDAEEVLRTANIQVGFGPNVKNTQIFKQAADKLLVSVRFIDPLPEKVFANGFSFSGQVSKLLDQLTTQVGYKWSIQNGELLVLGPKTTDKTTAVFLGPDSGLIGYPTKTKDGVECEALLNADIAPGKAVVVESARFMKGAAITIKVNTTVHEGDTGGDKWTVKIEGEIV